MRPHGIIVRMPALQPAPAVVTWRALLLSAAALLLVLGALTVALAHWVWTHGVAHVSLKEQPVHAAAAGAGGAGSGR